MVASRNATTLRMDDYTKAVVDSAARFTNQTRSAFILSVLREKAEEIIETRSKIMQRVAPLVLSPKDSAIFLDALERDFAPSQAFIDLEKRHDSLNITDRT